METPQFTNKIKDGLLCSSRLTPNYLMCAPVKSQNKKTLAIKRNIILTSGHTSGVRQLDFKSSPVINEIVLMQARLFQDQSPETPLRKNNILDNEKETTIVQSQKRKYIESDYDSQYNESQDKQMVDENKSNTEKRYNKYEMKYKQYNSQAAGKKLKQILPFRSQIRFSSVKDEQPLFNLYRDRDIHSNIGCFNQNYKTQANDNDCSTDEETIQIQVNVLTESIVCAINQD